MKTRLKTVKQTRSKASPSRPSKATATQHVLDDTCYICHNVTETPGSICNGCNKNLKSICTNKKSPTDKALADAIQIRRAFNRSVLVKKAVERLCKSCKRNKKTCQDLRNATRSFKDR